MAARRTGAAAAAVLALWAACGPAPAAPLLLPGGQAVQHAELPGVPRWRLVPFLWVDKSVNVTCEFTKEFKVYAAPSVEALAAKVAARESVWCGWHHFLGQHSCVARVSPFGTVHVAVEHEWSSAKMCSLQLAERVSPAMLAQTAAGAALFLFASRLSASVFFRLGTGSAGVMLLSLLILLFLVSRTLPSKKSAAALFAIFGSSFTGLVRYVFGQWIPSFEQLVTNKVFLAYMGVSGLAGVAVTYYYDREDNVRLHNILKYGLKLVGLALLAFGTSMPEASATACCGLLAWQLLHPALFLWRRGEVSTRALSDLVSQSPAPMLRRPRPKGKAAVVRQPSRLRPATPAAPPPAAGSGGSDSDEGIDPSEAVSLEPALEGREEGEVSGGSGSTGDSSGRACAAAARVPFPDEGRGPAAGASEARPRGGGGAPAAFGVAASDSPWLKRGLALNLETGRTVKMGGNTWNKLVLQGYQVDRTQGTLTPPAKARGGGAGGSAFAPSPASRVKARRSPAA